MGKGINGIIFGGVVGAAIGLLYAPRSGRKTRALLSEKTDSLLGEEAQNNGTVLGEVAKKTKNLVDASSAFIDNATNGKLSNLKKSSKVQNDIIDDNNKVLEEDSLFDNVRPVFDDKDDELKKKIDSAREKIASQVARNIEEQISNKDNIE